jgi:signal peptidase I
VTPQNHTTHNWLLTLAIGRNPKFTLVRASVLALVAVIVFKFILLPVRVTGGSMEPTYHDHRINFINRLAYWNHAPQRGDVVGIRYAGRSVMLLKRIVGCPGELVGFQYGRVTINGSPLDEPYVKLPSDWNRYPVQLGDDEYFVVGDNRSMPMENHMFGIAKRDRIVGKTLL